MKANTEYRYNRLTWAEINDAIAAAIVDEATDEDASATEDDGKDPNAVALGRKGGAKGGPARAKKLSPERRREIARQAAAARWAKRDELGASE